MKWFIPSKKRNPQTLFQGIKKSDSENVYSSLKGLGANHIRITAAKIQKKINTKFLISKHNKTGQRPVGVCRIVRGPNNVSSLPGRVRDAFTRYDHRL